MFGNAAGRVCTPGLSRVSCLEPPLTHPPDREKQFLSDSWNGRCFGVWLDFGLGTILRTGPDRYKHDGVFLRGPALTENRGLDSQNGLIPGDFPQVE